MLLFSPLSLHLFQTMRRHFSPLYALFYLLCRLVTSLCSRQLLQGWVVPTYGRLEDMLFDRSRLFSLVIFHETQCTFAFFVSLSISATRSTLRSAVLVIVFAECSGATWQAAVGCDKLLRSTAAHVSTLPRFWNNYQQTLHVLSWTRLGKTYQVPGTPEY